MVECKIGDIIQFDQDEREGVGIVEGLTPDLDGNFYAVRVLTSIRNGIVDDDDSLHTCSGFFKGEDVGWNVHKKNVLEVLESAGNPRPEVSEQSLMEVLACG